MKKLVIFGAKSIALGVYLAIRELYEDYMIVGFLVSNKEGNPDTLAGLPVYELEEFTQRDICVLIAVPEDIQEEVSRLLKQRGFYNHVCMDSYKENDLMERYYSKNGLFPSLHML